VRQKIEIGLFRVLKKSSVKTFLYVQLKGVLNPWRDLMLSDLAGSPCDF
jgi:hypothetical protein